MTDEELIRLDEESARCSRAYGPYDDRTKQARFDAERARVAEAKIRWTRSMK